MTTTSEPSTIGHEAVEEFVVRLFELVTGVVSSTLHHLAVSLAVGGAGLGTVWGKPVAGRMLADAGFDDVVVHDAPGNTVFVTRKKAA